MPRFSIQTDGTYKKNIKINQSYYEFTLQKETLDKIQHRIINNHIAYIIRQIRKGSPFKLKYGTVTLKTHPVGVNVCDICDKTYKTRSGYLKHIKKHHTTLHDTLNITNTMVMPSKTSNITMQDITTEHKETLQIHEPINISNINVQDITTEHNETLQIHEPISIPYTTESKTDTGYIYCFETESMPGTYKIGMTTRDVDVRLKEANQSNTWKPPIPYQVVFSKYVQNPREKEGMIHTLLSEYRIHPDREFFKLELEKLRCLFGLITEIKE